jgi:hypothetical protein
MVDPKTKPAASDLETITSTILTAVERQLTRYFSAMTQQAEAARLLAEQSRDEIRRELDERIPAVEELLRNNPIALNPTEQVPVIDEAAMARLAELEEALQTLRTDTLHAESERNAAAAAAAEQARQAALANDQHEHHAARLTELETHLKESIDRTEELRVANEAYQTALQTALEERLGEFANHQHWRINDIEDKLAALPTGIDDETMMEIRQTVRDDMERSFGAVHARLDDLVAADKRADELAVAHALQVRETTDALSVRMDEGEQRAAQVVDERLATLQTELNVTFAGVAEQVTELSTTLLGKIDAAEDRGVDRLLELEGRIGEDLGTKIANLDATIGRIAGGFDDAMIALNQRLLELENRLYEFDDRMNLMAEELSKVDESAMDEMRAEMSRAVGEATLVRIEFDRVVASMTEKTELQTIRMSEIEGLLIDHMDVSTAVQLERLDELERQMALVEPPHIAKVERVQEPVANMYSDGGASFTGGTSEAGAGEVGTDVTPPGGISRTPPSMSLNPRVNATDTPSDAGTAAASDVAADGNNDGSRETESTFSTH